MFSFVLFFGVFDIALINKLILQKQNKLGDTNILKLLSLEFLHIPLLLCI